MRQIAKSTSNFQLCLHFKQRTSGLRYEAVEVWTRCSSMAFSQIAGHRHGRAAQLACQSVDLILREASTCSVNVSDKLHRLLPCDQITVSAHFVSPRLSGTSR